MSAHLSASVRRLGAMVMLAGTSFLVGTSSLLVPQQSAAAMAKLEPVLEQDLAAMTTAAEPAELIEPVAAQSAIEGNLAIPTMKNGLERAGRFAGIPMGSSYYATATDCLAQAVYYEAALEPERGRRAVAQVVLNRVRHPAYPNSVCGVVYQGWNQPVCQFSFTCDGALMRQPRADLWRDAHQIARDALAGHEVAEVGTATHYHADYVLPYWAYRLGKIATIGRHIFYRFPGSPGRSASFYGRWAGREHKPKIDFARFRERTTVELAENDKVTLTPGLTVTPDVKDRHAAGDIGGRIDTTKTWRLSIPDPVQLSAGYRSTLSGQGEMPANAKLPSEQVQ